MNATERNTWVSLLASLIVNAWFGHVVWTLYASGADLAPDGLQIWARSMLWVIPVSIVANIGLTILASIIESAVTGQPRTLTLKDERDRQFELHGMGAMILLVVVSFLGAMIWLSLGGSAFNAFNLIYLGFFLGDICNSLVKLGLYRCS